MFRKIWCFIHVKDRMTEKEKEGENEIENLLS